MKSSLVSGWKMPERMFPATSRPLPAVVNSRVELDQAMSPATRKASSSFQAQVLGAFW